MAVSWRLPLLFAAALVSALSAIWWSFQGVREVVEILPETLSIRVQGGDMWVLLKRGTRLPATGTETFTTTVHNQRHARVHVFVGEGPSSGEWRLLASLNVEPLPEMSFEGLLQLEVSVTAEAWGSVTCFVREEESMALGQSYAQDGWVGTLTDSPPSQDDTGKVNFSQDEIKVMNRSLKKPPQVIRLGNRHVQLAGGRRVVIEQEAWGVAGVWETGGALWDSAVVLADFVAVHRESFGWTGKRILELGAGTGLVAITFVKEGAAKVLATQNHGRSCEALLNNIEKNINTSSIISSDIRCDVLRWSSSTDIERAAQEGPWDAIVGSDLLYPENAEVSGNALLASLATLASNRTQVVLTFQERHGVVRRFIDTIPRKDWTVDLVPAETSLSADAKAYLLQNGSNKSGPSWSHIQVLHLFRPVN